MNGFLGFRNEILEMVARIKIPKYKVLSPRKENGRVLTLSEFNDRALCLPSEIDRSNPYVQKLDMFYNTEDSVREKVKIPDLFPPGKIMQLYRTVNLPPSNTGCCSCRFNSDSAVDNAQDVPYTARWAECHDFRRIILSSHFLSDHETDNVRDQLHLLAGMAGLEEPFAEVLRYGRELDER